MTDRRLLALLAVVVLLSGCGRQEEVTKLETTLDQAVRERREAFVESRDRILQASDSVREGVLAGRHGDAGRPWRERFVVWVLEAWQRHESLYRKLLDMPRHPDASGRQRYLWVTRRPADVERQIQWTAPLLLELLLLESAGRDARDDALALLPRVARSGLSPEDEAFLLEGTRSDSGLDEKQRRLLAWALASIEHPKVDALDVVRTIEADRAAGGDRYVSRYLLDLVGRACWKRKTDLDRGEVAKALLQGQFKKDLKGLVDEEYFVQRVGRVGGRKATEEVLRFREKEPANRRRTQWVVELAGNLHYDTPGFPELLMSAILGNAAGFAATEEARSLALRSVLRLARRHKNTPSMRQKLRDLLKAVENADPALFNNAPFRALRTELEEILGD